MIPKWNILNTLDSVDKIMGTNTYNKQKCNVQNFMTKVIPFFTGKLRSEIWKLQKVSFVCTVVDAL